MKFDLRHPLMNVDDSPLFHADASGTAVQTTAAWVIRRVIGEAPAAAPRTVADQVRAFDLFKATRDRPEEVSLSQGDIDFIKESLAPHVAPFVFGQIAEILDART